MHWQTEHGWAEIDHPEQRVEAPFNLGFRQNVPTDSNSRSLFSYFCLSNYLKSNNC